MNNKLKPCPFCGGKAEKMVNDDRASHLFIWCTSCGISTDVYFAEDLKEAVAAWNRRSDAVPVVRGEWIEHPAKDSVLCSYCHADWNLFDNDTYRFCYCPNCGAKMESEGSI